MTDPVRLGFIGAGLIALAHARNLSPVAGAEIGPVHDLDPARAHRLALEAGGKAFVAGSAESVIAECDAVYVCTWTAAHAIPVMAAAEAGRAVFCEKPLAVDRATVDDQALIEIGETRSSITARLGEPAERMSWTKQDEAIFGPIESFWAEVPLGATIEIWRFPVEDAWLEAYFVDGSDTVQGTTIAPKDAVY